MPEVFTPSPEVTQMVVPATPRGEFAQFEQARPTDLAAHLGISYTIDSSILRILALFNDSFDEIESLSTGPDANNDQMIDELKQVARTSELYTDALSQTDEERMAAQAARETFGNVDTKDTNNLSLLVVWNALLHNVHHAAEQETEVFTAVVTAINQLQEIIHQQIAHLDAQLKREKQARLTNTQRQELVISQQMNQGYSQLQPAGELIVRTHQQVIGEESIRIDNLTKQLNNLEELRKSLENIVIFAAHEQLVLAQPVLSSFSSN